MLEKLDLKITGNPFVDLGIYALECMVKKGMSEITLTDLKIHASKLSKIYVQPAWKREVYSVFPNSLLVNPSSTNNPKLEVMYFNYLNQLIDSIGPIEHGGPCIGCGSRGVVGVYGKDAIPLSGSKSLINFFPFLSEGANYCPLCVVLIQFSLLIMYRCGEKLFFLHSNSDKVMELWAKMAFENIELQTKNQYYVGCFRKFSHFQDIIFDFIINVIDLIEFNNGEVPSFNFYEFSNFNQNPQLNIHFFPNNSFNFLRKMPNGEKDNWKNIVKNSHYSESDNEGMSSKNYSNDLYVNLMEDRSILMFFYSKKLRKTYCSWDLVNFYLKEARQIDERRIDGVKRIADRLSDFIQKTESIRLLMDLEIFSNYPTSIDILKLISEEMEHSNKLFSLISEGDNLIDEITDLLLFRVYENLHDWLNEITAHKMIEI